MIEIMPESSENVVGIRARGRLTDADYRNVLIPHLDALLRKHGKLNLLFFMDRDFEGWDVEAAWDDASYGLRHRADFGKLAIVGGPDWVAWMVHAIGFLMKGEVRVFPADALDRAWAWVKA